jgi:hypothetical protein
MQHDIITSHDLANMIEAIPRPEGITTWEDPIVDLIDYLRTGSCLRYQRCRDCQEIKLLLTEFDLCDSNTTGHSYSCKACRRLIKNSYRRRVRFGKKFSPEDLAEIQRIRLLAGMSPIPYGPDAPKPGRPTREQSASIADTRAKMRERYTQ